MICVYAPQIKSSTLGLYRLSKAPSGFFIHRLKSPAGLLFKLNIMNVVYLVSSPTAKISKSFFFTVMWNINFAEIQVPMNNNTHTPFGRFWRQRLDPNIKPGNARCSRSCSSMWCSLKHSTWGYTLFISNEFITSSVLLLSPLMVWWKIWSELNESTVLSWFINSRHFDHTH